MPNLLANIFNLPKVNFVYHHWGCTSIYRHLSYPFGSLKIKPNNKKCKIQRSLFKKKIRVIEKLI